MSMSSVATATPVSAAMRRTRSCARARNAMRCMAERVTSRVRAHIPARAPRARARRCAPRAAPCAAEHQGTWMTEQAELLALEFEACPEAALRQRDVEFDRRARTLALRRWRAPIQFGVEMGRPGGALGRRRDARRAAGATS